MIPTEDAHRIYLNNVLNKPDFALLRNTKISTIVTGSSADNRVDGDSDWDYKIFVGTAAIQPFMAKHGAKFALTDDAHNPRVFVMVRPFAYLESEFEKTLAVTLWICEKAKVLRDDGGVFQRYLLTYRAEFERTLPEQIQHKYLKLRTRRHGIDSMVKRRDVVAIRMLAQDCIKTSLQMLHLLHGEPYPYPQWLHKVTINEYFQDYPEVFESIEALGSELRPDQIQVRSRKLVGSMIDTMVTKGFNREKLERWWMHI